MIYARITINGRRSELSLGRGVEEQRWSPRAGKLRGSSMEVLNYNRFLDIVRNRLFEIYDEHLKLDKETSPSLIKNVYLGKEGKEYMVLEIFKEHNEEIESLLGKGFTKGTSQRYKAAFKHVSDYIRHKYQHADMPVKKIDFKSITGLEFYLKSVKGLEQNTTIKYIVNFKKIIRIAYANEWITKDPFFHWKASWKTKEKQYLTQAELDTLKNKKSFLPRLGIWQNILSFLETSLNPLL